MPAIPERILAKLKAPGANNDTHLELVADGLRCVESAENYPFVDGVPSLFIEADGTGAEITTKVKEFYEEYPFPNYDGIEEFGRLVNKGNSNPFSSELLKAIGFNKTILECGCGTGQLSQYLQLNNNYVLGIDASFSSLKLAIDHKRQNGLARSGFSQMNIFDMAIKDNTFDVVIAHGVLHHTFDARRAFAEVVRKAKPGGIVIVGLYNSYARLPTWLRSKIIGVFGGKIDYVVRNRIQDAKKAEIWIKDQYFNPHETWHSIDEVLQWFKENDVEYLNCSPAILGTSGEDAQSMFSRTHSGTRYQRMVTQLGWLWTISREGALFDLIGRKGIDPA